MGDEIRDLDDVEAWAWATAFAAGVRWAESYPGRPAVFADECVRLLRERRAQPEDKLARMGAEWVADVAAAREREKIVAPLRGFDSLTATADAIERGEHDK